mmetsp:Transcript_67177/g.148854  ORF Transcript_67177/g.148854 Transcript_67177/m.148854 type:complete len:286 (+) Transcript_67177:147-1004(+)
MAGQRQKYTVLSSLPETSTIQGFFKFVLIGPDAKALQRRILDSDMHAEMAEKAAHSSTRLSRFSKTPAVTFDVRDKDDKPALGGTYVRLHEYDEDGSDLARVRFALKEDFSSSLPSIDDAAAIRTTCFIFLHDSRCAKDADSCIKTAFAEMNFHYSAVTQRVSLAKVPALRAVFLNHQGKSDVTEVTPAENEEGKSDVMEVTPAENEEAPAGFFNGFCEQLEKAARTSPSWRVQRNVDFDSSEALYDMVTCLVREMYFSNHARHSEISGNSFWPQRRRSACCALQ